jgi:hypothetical protein
MVERRHDRLGAPAPGRKINAPPRRPIDRFAIGLATDYEKQQQQANELHRPHPNQSRFAREGF